MRRFYDGSINWMGISLELFNHYYYCSESVYLLCGGETVEGKAGKHTPGKGWYFSSIFGVVIPGVCFFGLSVLDVSRGTSWIAGYQQLNKDPKGNKKTAKTKSKKKRVCSKKAEQEQQPTAPKKRGRKKGSKNKPYQVGYLFTVLSGLLGKFKTHLASVGCTMPILVCQISRISN